MHASELFENIQYHNLLNEFEIINENVVVAMV